MSTPIQRYKLNVMQSVLDKSPVLRLFNTLNSHIVVDGVTETDLYARVYFIGTGITTPTLNATSYNLLSYWGYSAAILDDLNPSLCIGLGIEKFPAWLVDGLNTYDFGSPAVGSDILHDIEDGRVTIARDGANLITYVPISIPLSVIVSYSYPIQDDFLPVAEKVDVDVQRAYVASSVERVRSMDTLANDINPIVDYSALFVPSGRYSTFLTNKDTFLTYLTKL